MNKTEYYNGSKENMNVNGNMNLYDPNQAFMAGTIFRVLDDPYKNYRMPSLMPTNEKDALMMEIQKYCLVTHDLDLYLDVFPNDENALELRKKYWEMYNEVKKIYEERYCPFTLSAKSNNKLPFPWSTSVFPWGDE